MDALEKLNFELAYRRVQDELSDQRKSARAFVLNPYEQELVELDLDGWLDHLRATVLERSYAPDEIHLCSAPKGKGLVRPGVLMSLADRVVYTAAVGACVKPIVTATGWSQRKIDFAPLFHKTKPQQRHWLLNPFLGWEAWTEQTLHKLNLSRTKFVVTADIAGYFENVSISRLKSEMTRIRCPADIVELVTSCLLRWSMVRNRGLPQGVLASDVLSKLYLESFDRRLKNDGLTHVRYSDDIRVFCRSEAEARRALVLVIELLRERGLTTQSAKTRIRKADDKLAEEFAGAVPVVKRLHQEYIEGALASGLIDAEEASVPASVVDDLMNAEPDAMDPEVFRLAFDRFVVGVQAPNRTMFRFLLRRLAGANDRCAVTYVARHMIEAPEAIPEILRYFEDLDSTRGLEKAVRRALTSRELSMYPYSRFLLVNWLAANGSPKASTLAALRKQAFDTEHPDYLRAAARKALGAFGDASDLDKMATLLRSSRDPLERAQLLCSLQRLEKARRNGLAGRLKNETPWGPLAAKYVRQTRAT